MIKTHYRDYATEAFRLLALEGSAEKYRSRIWNQAIEDISNSESRGGSISAPTEAAIMRAQKALDDARATIFDLESAEFALETLEKMRGRVAIKAVKAVYMALANAANMSSGGGGGGGGGYYRSAKKSSKKSGRKSGSGSSGGGEWDVLSIYNAARDASSGNYSNAYKLLESSKNDNGGLSQMYLNHGFIPVARTAFVDEYAPSDWNYERDGRPDIIFWAHNGDNADITARNIGTQEMPDLTALPLMEYDEAAKYRDSLIPSKRLERLEQRLSEQPMFLSREGIDIQNQINEIKAKQQTVADIANDTSRTQQQADLSETELDFAKKLSQAAKNLGVVNSETKALGKEFFSHSEEMPSLQSIQNKSVEDLTSEDYVTIVKNLVGGGKQRLYTKETSRVFDTVAGGNKELRNTLYNIFEKPFNEAGGHYGKSLTSSVESYKEIMRIKSLTDYGVPIDNYVSVISALADKGLKAKDNDLNTDDKKKISKQIFDMQGLTEKQKTALVRKTIGDNWIADFSSKAAFSIANDYGKSEYKKYAKAKEETGITAEQYVELKDKIKNKAFKGTDENGKTVYYLKQCKLANYVDSLDASEEVKKYIWDSVYSDDDDREYEDRHKKLVYRDGEWYTPSGKN